MKTIQFWLVYVTLVREMWECPVLLTCSFCEAIIWREHLNSILILLIFTFTKNKVNLVLLSVWGWAPVWTGVPEMERSGTLPLCSWHTTQEPGDDSQICVPSQEDSEAWTFCGAWTGATDSGYMPAVQWPMSSLNFSCCLRCLALLPCYCHSGYLASLPWSCLSDKTHPAFASSHQLIRSKSHLLEQSWESFWKHFPGAETWAFDGESRFMKMSLQKFTISGRISLASPDQAVLALWIRDGGGGEQWML